MNETIQEPQKAKEVRDMILSYNKLLKSEKRLPIHLGFNKLCLQAKDAGITKEEVQDSIIYLYHTKQIEVVSTMQGKAYIVYYE